MQTHTNYVNLDNLCQHTLQEFMDLEKILALTKNLSVLIVEDELALRESFQFLLQNLFAEVDTAEDGQEALNKMDERDYDIV